MQLWQLGDQGVLDRVPDCVLFDELRVVLAEQGELTLDEFLFFELFALSLCQHLFGLLLGFLLLDGQLGLL